MSNPLRLVDGAGVPIGLPLGGYSKPPADQKDVGGEATDQRFLNLNRELGQLFDKYGVCFDAGVAFVGGYPSGLINKFHFAMSLGVKPRAEGLVAGLAPDVVCALLTDFIAMQLDAQPKTSLNSLRTIAQGILGQASQRLDENLERMWKAVNASELTGGLPEAAEGGEGGGGSSGGGADSGRPS